jgi:tetratricopeptide (TPR) repeat protein
MLTPMLPEQSGLEAAIAALEAQRAALGDAVVDASSDALRSKHAALTAVEVNPAQAYLDDLDTAWTLAMQGRAEARAAGLRRHEGLFINTLSVVAGLRNDLVAGLELDHQHLAIQQEIGNRRGEAIGHGNLGTGWLALGDVERARHHLEEGLRLARSNGDRQSQCGPLADLSRVALWQGDNENAHALARSALEVARAAQALDWVPNALIRVGSAELALAWRTQAEQTFLQALDAAQAIDSPWQPHAMAGLAQVALARDDIDSAMQWVERLLGLPALDGRYIELICFRVLAHAGDVRAAGVLRCAHEAMHVVAATLDDAELRQQFLRQIPEHRELESSWRDTRLGRAP